MKLRLASFVLLVGIPGSNVVHAQDTPTDSLLVLSKAD
jgi:hypothetical protein